VATSTSTVNQGTQRTDAWQLQPILAGLALLAFGVYALWRAFQNAPSEVPGTNYISPLYTPYLPHLLHTFGISVPAWEKTLPSGNLGWIFSPALLIMWVPIGFRATCYFYRRVYYRSFFTAPAACAVDVNPKSPLMALIGSGKKYMGETLFPMVLMNLHRYFFYLAALFIFLHTFDALFSYFLPGFAGLRIGLGSLVVSLDVVLLALYAFGCHSWRHIIGGRLDCFSSCPMGEMRHHAFERQGLLNRNHGLFGWVSLGWVVIADLYIMAVSKGLIPDFVFYSNTWKGIFG
jgi:hypothetical protein